MSFMSLTYVEAGSVVWNRAEASLGVRILVALDRVVTKEENEIISRAAETIIKELAATQQALSPIRQPQNSDERKNLLATFDTLIFVDKIPNGYCSDYCCRDRPWFIVTTNIGRIKIGWRKRVIHIEWTETVVCNTAEELFLGEDTTKFDKVIHAWSYEKAKEYIKCLHQPVGTFHDPKGYRSFHTSAGFRFPLDV